MGAEVFDQAVTLHREGRLAEAVELYEAVARETLTVNLAQNLGSALYDLGRLEAAEHWLRMAWQARSDNAVAELVLGETLLALGRYAEGWPRFEARARAFPDAARGLAAAAEWTGVPLDGQTIVIVHEQGLGDQIQFARFAPLLKARGAGRVILTCHPDLRRLLSQLPGVDEVVGVSEGQTYAPPAPFVWCRCMSLAGRLGVTADAVPAGPYLGARPRAAGGVGVVMAGNAQNPRHRFRTPPPEIGAALLSLPGAVSLDRADTGARDVMASAELIAGLDLVISVDTSLAHLAGALGKPVWVLLPAWGTDWRWMRGRTDSPWYASARLFRQREPGDWPGVVDEVRRALR